ncbi:MAG: hypothetical protein KDI88_14510 [Gammaproteobacteria bacterium]|nr:hypothetical protein [Gammaproteobacteria bacterium]
MSQPRCLALYLALCTVPLAASASVRPVQHDDFSNRSISCEAPFRLTRDCSIRQGASRQIVIDGLRMSLAADHDGDTLLITAPRPQEAVRRLTGTLRHRGICVRHVQPVHGSQGVTGYYLQFSGNAYDYLSRYTTLDGADW